MTPEDLSELYRTFERTAFRLECRDTYSIPGEDPDFDDFLAGRPVAPRTVDNDEWLANIATQVAAGKHFGRVRLLGRPVTDYTRFELASYPENIAAGEQVWILDRQRLEAGNDAWTHQDFWLFDDRIAVLQHYDEAGRFLGVEQARDASPYVAIKRRALALAVAFEDFQLVPAQRQGWHDQQSRVGALDQ